MSLRNLQNKVKVCTLQDKSLQFAKKKGGLAIWKKCCAIQPYEVNIY